MPGYSQPVVDSTTVFRRDIFDGKVLFCTGGGSGICRGMVESMMKHGANAVIIGRNLERLQHTAAELSKSTGKTCLPIQADVRQPQTLRDAVAKTITALSRIDFVICGAAGNYLAPISGISENAFKTVIDIDTLGTYNTVKATVAQLRESKGAYIHVSATLHYRGSPYQAHVSSAKAAVDALSRVIAVEEGPHGIRSNVIAPGPVANTEGMTRLSTPDSLAEMGSQVPAGRLGAIQDIANATVFLFSLAAADITGQILVVDGGHENLRGQMVPYPQAVLDPETFIGKRAKM